MAETYSQDLRDRVLAAYDNGMQTKQIADVFKVSASWARRVKQVRSESGRTSALPRGGARIIKIDMQRLAELVSHQPDATAQELREQLQVQCDQTSITRALARLDITLKKRQSTPRNRTARTSPKNVADGKANNISTKRTA